MIFFSLFLACSTQSNDKISSSQKTYSSIMETDVDTLYAKQKQNENLVIVDVRTKSEYNSGHIPNAKSIPLSSLSESLSQLDIYKEQDIFLVCAVGGRSQKATELLRSKGFSKAINVQGGTRGWKAKGHPLQ